MTQIQLSLPDRVMDAIRAEAGQLGITPNILARIQLCSMFGSLGVDVDKKAYVIRLENWRETEAYLGAKTPGWSVSDFAAKTIAFEIKRCPLKLAQKAEFDRILKK